MPIRQFRCARLFLSAIAFAVAAGAASAALPVRTERVLAGMSAPVDFAATASRPRDLFIVEQGGRIRIARDGALLPVPFLDLAPLVASGGERGLLGLALHPQFAANGRFFVDYTRAGDGATVIASFTVSEGDPDRADPGSRRELLVIAQPYENHNGGALRFGSDGYLYIGMGDGGSGNDPGNRAQNPQDLLGKILRIDVDTGIALRDRPPGNMYAVTGHGRPEIWATGVRNPWKFSFDRATGDLYIGDVGQDAQEEIDFLPFNQGSGTNFGWRVVEGTRCTGLDAGVRCPSSTYAPPILTYDHGEGCSVTGGVVYRGRDLPVLYGRYVYGDFCSGRLWSAARDANGAWRSDLLLETGHQITAIGEDARGELYWTDLRTGDVHRLAPDAHGPRGNRVLQCRQRALLPDRLPGGGGVSRRRRIQRRLAAHGVRLRRGNPAREQRRRRVPLLRRGRVGTGHPLLHRRRARVHGAEGESALDVRGHRVSRAAGEHGRMHGDHTARLPALQQSAGAGGRQPPVHDGRRDVRGDDCVGVGGRGRRVLREIAMARRTSRRQASIDPPRRL